MNYQETVTLARNVANLVDEFENLGFQVSPGQISRLIGAQDCIDLVDDRCYTILYRWVEPAIRVPGELYSSPVLVFCSLSPEPGSAVNRTYVHV